MSPSIKRLTSIVAISTAVAMLGAVVSAQEKKLTIDELISQHLNSIGSAQARVFPKNRLASGTVKLISRIGTASELEGQAAMASSGPKLRYSMKFAAPQYPGEQFSFDGSKVLTGYLPSGRRSPMSLYLEQQNITISSPKTLMTSGQLTRSWFHTSIVFNSTCRLRGDQASSIGTLSSTRSPQSGVGRSDL